MTVKEIQYLAKKLLSNDAITGTLLQENS